MKNPPTYEVRARYDEKVVRVYQAYSPQIAYPAIKAGRFVPPFKLERMTWIKPSFNWMMYRSGFAGKPGQECVLGIDITREGFEWALEHAVLSVFHPEIHGSHDDWRRLLDENSVRIQWDPERDWRLQTVEGVRAIQIGLSGEAVLRYVNEWIIAIEDVTQLAHSMAKLVQDGEIPRRRPDQEETAYELSEEVCKHLVPNF